MQHKSERSNCFRSENQRGNFGGGGSGASFARITNGARGSSAAPLGRGLSIERNVLLSGTAEKANP